MMQNYLLQILPIVMLSINLFSQDLQIDELDLPELGDRVSGAVSSEQERAIGQMFS